jgi:hypothetical protein
MIRYNETSQRLWLSRDFLALSDRAKLLWIFLLTGPIKTSLAGIYNAGIGTCTDHLRISVDVFKKAFKELEDRGMAEACWETNVIYLPRWIHHNRGPANPNVLKSWLRILSAIPDGALKEKFVIDLRELLAVNTTFFGILTDWIDDNPIDYAPIVEQEAEIVEVDTKNEPYIPISRYYIEQVKDILNPVSLNSEAKMANAITTGANEVRLLIEREKVDMEELKETLRWVIDSYDPSNDFTWLPNLMSLASIRKKSKSNSQIKYDNIRSSMAMRSRQSGSDNNDEYFK